MMCLMYACERRVRCHGVLAVFVALHLLSPVHPLHVFPTCEPVCGRCGATPCACMFVGGTPLVAL
jgi:hypothetical protein